MIDEERDAKGPQGNQAAEDQGQHVVFDQGLEGVPGPLLMLAEAPQIHGVADDLHPIQRGEDQRHEDVHDVLEPGAQALLFRQVQPSGLLGQGDVVVVPDHVGEIAQGQGHGEGRLVAHADGAEGRGELAGIGGQQKHHAQGDHGQILEHLGQLVEELLLCDGIPGREGEKLVLRSVELHPVLRAEEEGEHEVDGDEDQHIVEHDLDLGKPDLRQVQHPEGEHQYDQDHPGVVGIHDREREDEEAEELGHARQVEHEVVLLDVVKQLSFHGGGPPRNR